MNLVCNAIKFTKEGSIQVLVKKQLGKEGETTLLFEVKDTGIGIPKENREKLFEAFAQIDNSTTRTETGTGLGLTICKQLVELMNGQIWLESEIGIGSSFFLEIPLKKSVTSVLPTAKQSIWKDGETTNINPSKILLVEDDKINQLLAEKILNKLGYAIAKATNGLEAVEMISQEHYDIIFMDLQMPIMDGIEATRKIRQKDVQQPIIIAMTANAMPQDKERCFAAGMNMILFPNQLMSVY